MRVAHLSLLACAAAALLAPASAHATLNWYDAGAGVPATVDLQDVARLGDMVVAVGTDTTTGAPAVYRFDGTAWWRDTVPAVAAGKLVDVAVTSAGAWAVGENGTGPLAIHLPPPPPPPPVVDDPTATIPPPAAREWTVLATPGSAHLRTISSTGNLAGDAGGKVWSVSATALTDAGTIPARLGGSRIPGVNGIAGDHAVTDGGLGEDRIFKLGTPIAAEGSVPDTVGLSLLSVARHGSSVVAIDSGAYWQPDGPQGLWRRKTAGIGAADFELVDLSMAGDIAALAGNTSAGGYVWHGTVGNWQRKRASTARVNGVFAVGTEDVWAAGNGGTLVRYWNRPDPPTGCTANCEGTGGGGTGGNTGTTDPGTTYGSTTTTSGNTTTTVIQPERKGDPTIFVVEPRQPATRRKRPRRLLDRVKVRRYKRKLVVSFRLRAPARVAIAAKRGRATVSRASMRARRAGRRRVVLPFKGSPPNQLRIVVRPLRAKRA